MKRSCSIFVGNVEFDIPEERLTEELSAVGRIVSFRMLHDRHTGKPKGYGFCEYESPMIAETAVKTLKIEFNGRPVIINYADNEMISKSKSKELELTSIISVLETMDRNNLKEVIFYIKKLAVDEPQKLKNILKGNPHLAAAVLYALVLLNLVKPAELQQFVKDTLSLEQNREQIMERLLSYEEHDLSRYPESVRERILAIRNLLKSNEDRNL